MPDRAQPGAGVWWAWACIVMLASGALTQVLPGAGWTVPVGFGLGTLYPALLLGGALRFRAKQAPRWLAPGAFGVGLVRGLVYQAGFSELSLAAAVAVEPALAVAAAVAVARTDLHGPSTPVHRALPVALVAVGILDGLTGLIMLPGGELAPQGLIRAWLLGAPALLALQLTAWGDLSRRQLERVREQLEERVAEQTERYRTVSELSSDYSFSYRLTPEGFAQTEWVTDAVTRMTGFAPEEFEGLGWLEIIHPGDRESLLKQLEGFFAGEDQPNLLDTRIITKSGEVRWLNMRYGAVEEIADGGLRIVGAVSDITERVRAEQERQRLDLHMREMQRLESLGRLAGGIAHDFNNVLTVILGNAKLALEDLDRGKLDRARLQRIRSAAQYAAGLTDQILTYSGKAAVAVQAVDLSSLVREMLDLLRAVVSEQTVLDVHLPDGLPAVEGDVTQLRQLLVNLVTNASEALGEEGGTVRIRTGARGFGEEELGGGFGTLDPEPGHYVVLEVEDTGAGLDSSPAAQLFEPFFTTKTAGRGLGLAAVHGIVRGHRGVILVDSEPGRGTAFQILLPRSLRQAVSAQRKPPARRLVGRGTVLLVDDDADVLEVAQEFLRRAGFEVRSAGSGREAIELVREPGSEVDAVVLDLVMPGLTGEETFLALREVRPELPVVLSSGYDREQAAERFSARGITDFVRKPYEPEALVASVRNALAR
jgi:PAS domain S-box-containing protein